MYVFRPGRRIGKGISNGHYLPGTSIASSPNTMSTAIVDTCFYGFQLPLQYGCGQYEPSIASSVPSSQGSVFSSAFSVQSSIASSVSDDFRFSQDELRDRCTQASIEQQAKAGHAVAQQQAKLQCPSLGQDAKHALSYADVTSVPSEQRQHPRRSSLARNQKPPPLMRQCDRKHNFVDNLVGKHRLPHVTLFHRMIAKHRGRRLCNTNGGGHLALLSRPLQERRQ